MTVTDITQVPSSLVQSLGNPECPIGYIDIDCKSCGVAE
jgi:hypothetical protein